MQEKDAFDVLIEDKFKLVEDKEKEEEAKQMLKDCYFNIIDLLKEYCDIKEEFYSIIALWILGTYFHNNFPSFPYLFFNATKGSGKSRLMNLVVSLSRNGEMLNSLTEAVLFRTKGTLGIDEFEGVERKGSESLREMLNSCYKKGTKVKRMRKKRTLDGEEQVVEEFDVYRPIVMANIYGMNNVMEDRCITLILEKSTNKSIVNKIEVFMHEPIFKQIKDSLNLLVKNAEKSGISLNSSAVMLFVYATWNTHVCLSMLNNTSNYTIYNNSINYTNKGNNSTKQHELENLFKKVDTANLTGRELELCMPLFLISSEIDESVLDKTILTLKDIFSGKREEDFSENKDVMLIDFVSQKPENMERFEPISSLLAQFKDFIQTNEDYINSYWLGRALKRLNLIKQKRRQGRGAEVILNIKKAKEKILFFKKDKNE